jgi:hypothetical protein
MHKSRIFVSRYVTRADRAFASLQAVEATILNAARRLLIAVEFIQPVV